MTNINSTSFFKKISIAHLAEFLGIAGDGLSFWEIMAITAFTIGTLTIMSFAMPLDGGWWLRSSTMFAVGIGAWMGGGAIGFLFGVPRYKSTSDVQSLGPLSASAQNAIAFTPNTNLEQISDWLTKIIVGATLVQLNSIRDGFSALCENVALQFHQPQSETFCGGIIIFFFFSGFLWGYLWCSIRIFREMVHLTAQIQEGDPP